jgi:sugar phosphate isomerase/epimerase
MDAQHVASESSRLIGYEVEDDGRLDLIDKRLSAIADAGFTGAELYPGFWDVWLDGRLDTQRLNEYVEILDRHRDRLRYTLHGPSSANLFDVANRDRHERVLRTGLEIAGIISAETVVYHAGRRLPGGADTGLPMRLLMQQERSIVTNLVEGASAWNGRLGIETWIMTGETEYSYSVWPDQLAEQLAAIDHPRVGATLDFGHLFVSSESFGFDYVDGVRTLSQSVVHFHVVDSFGRPSRASGAYSQAKALEFGEGDIHLPPGYGLIPFEEIFREVEFPRRPTFIAEVLGERFIPRLAEIRKECERLMSLRAPSPHR